MLDRKVHACYIYVAGLCAILAGMDFLEPAERFSAALDDETLTAHRPLVRGQLVGYLRGLWELSTEALTEGKDQIRWAELQLRIVDRFAKLYQLDVAATPAPPEEDAGVEQGRVRALVVMQLDDLAKRDG